MNMFFEKAIGNNIIKGTKTASKFTIITAYPTEITKEITENLHHSSTKISAIGSFSNNDQSVIICVINKHQIIDLKNILKKYDKTFSFAETVNETYGNFKIIK